MKLSGGFEPKIVFESDSPSTVRDLIGAGMGVAFGPPIPGGTQRSSKVKLLSYHTSQLYPPDLRRSKNEKSSSPLKNDFYNFYDCLSQRPAIAVIVFKIN